MGLSLTFIVGSDIAMMYNDVMGNLAKVDFCVVYWYNYANNLFFVLKTYDISMTLFINEDMIVKVKEI